MQRPIGITLTLIILFVTSGYSQQDYKVINSAYDLISINPGAAGHKEGVCASLIHREQWTGFPGKPVFQLVNAHMPFRLLKRDHGVGLGFLNDKWGFNENMDLKAVYAYHASIGTGKLGIGVGINWQNRTLNPTWLTTPAMTPAEQDLSVPTGGKDEQVSAFDLSAGLFYYNEDLFFGISSTHINESNYSFIRGSDGQEVLNKVNRHYYIVSGYTMQLANPSYEFVPSVLVQSDGAAHILDLNLLLMYNKRIWGGVTFSPGVSFSGIAGFEVVESARVGIAFDFFNKPITNYQGLSYELMVNYCFRIGVEKTPQKYKSIRFL